MSNTRPNPTPDNGSRRRWLFIGLFLLAFAVIALGLVVLDNLLSTPRSTSATSRPTATPTVTASPTINTSTATVPATTPPATSAPSPTIAHDCEKASGEIIAPEYYQRVDGDEPLKVEIRVNCLPAGWKLRLMDQTNLLYATTQDDPAIRSNTATFIDHPVGGEGTKLNPTVGYVELLVFAGPSACIDRLDSDTIFARTPPECEGLILDRTTVKSTRNRPDKEIRNN